MDLFVSNDGATSAIDEEILLEFLDEAEASLAAIEPAVLRLERDPGDVAALSEAFRLMHTLKGTGGFLGLNRLAAVAHATENVLDRLRREVTAGHAGDPAMVGSILVALDRIGGLLKQSRAGGREPSGTDTDILALLRTETTGRQKAAEPSEAAVPQDPATESNTIRVAMPVLEQLQSVVGELLLARNQLLHHAEKVTEAGRDDNAVLETLAQRIAGITSELQSTVLRTRMQPVGQAWAKLPRLVRDLARSLGKDIVLETGGTDVELDRQVLELIRDPLTHMVRNSCDHGIELPAERAAAGKLARGLISLTARPEGGSVVVTLHDDGHGIDPARLRAKALAQGLATPAELAAMSPEQTLTLAFRPGLSTAAEVTALSGRGVGMDVVKTNIERMGGSVAIASTVGQGTTLTLTIPLTLAIVPALMLLAGTERFALPRIAVREVLRVPVARTADADIPPDCSGIVVRLDQTPLLRLRDGMLPLVDLAEVLGCERPNYSDDETRHVVVIRTGTLAFGLVVEPVFETEEIVVTPLCGLLRHGSGQVGSLFGGTTILGDGAVALVLDAAGLARAAGIASSAAVFAPPAVAIRAIDAEAAIRLLLFTAGGQSMAVPLGLIARLEQVAASAFEPIGDAVPGAYALLLRDRLIAARSLRAHPFHEPSEIIPTLMIADGHGRTAALAIDRIDDVIEARLDMSSAGVRPGVLGMALLDGHPTAVLDTRHWLGRIDPTWFNAAPDAGSSGTSRLLVVEDSDFFRQMLVPVLTAAGYAVTSTPSAAEALRLRDTGAAFDAIVTDVEMPEMDGLALARAVRAGGTWVALPIVALTARVAPADIAAGRLAGFSDHIRKFDRAALLAALERCVRPPLAIAA